MVRLTAPCVQHGHLAPVPTLKLVLLKSRSANFALRLTDVGVLDIVPKTSLREGSAAVGISVDGQSDNTPHYTLAYNE